MGEHRYETRIQWTGNNGAGTSDYRSYSRDYDIEMAGKAVIKASADPNYRGDPARHNPEDMLVATLSACHMLWYLHFCAVNKIVVEAYDDHAEGVMTTHKNGSGEFTEVILRPKIGISSGDMEKAKALHHDAHEFCFIARSVNFPVRCEPEISFTS